MRDAGHTGVSWPRGRGTFVRMSANAVARAVGGIVRGADDVIVSGAEVDSRLIRNGDLFIALPGARVDGHTFVPKVFERATAALVRDDIDLPAPPPNRALIEVADPLAAYHQLAAVDRRRRPWKVAAITGSVGKTTTKDFLAHILEHHCITGRSQGNRNSTLGLPAQILSQPDDVEIFVAEAGMSRPGELDILGEILRPEVLLYTRIAPAHTEFFSSMDQVVEAKAELLAHLSSEGVLVINADDPRQEGFAARTEARTSAYGRPNAEARLESLEDHGLEGTRGTLILPSGKAPFRLPLPGLHQAENFLAAATAAEALGLQASDIAPCAATLSAAAHRGNIIELDDEVTLIDDSYNASPEAVKRALELLAKCSGRRVAVLGEMYELGAAAAAAHREIGRHAAASCDLLLTVGSDLSAALIDGAVAAGLPHRRIHHVNDSDAATATLKELLEPGDTILIKGSRSIGLDKVVSTISGGMS